MNDNNNQLTQLLKVAIVGKPNVGKSSLINAILQKKVSIVNKKPQTTRNNIKFNYETDDVLIQYYDTPGFHNSNNKLDDCLNKFVQSSLKSVDLVYLLIDLTRPIDNEDNDLMQLVLKLKKPIMLIFTKSDIIQYTDELLSTKQELINSLNPIKVIDISSLTNNLSDLLDYTISVAKQTNNIVLKLLYTQQDDDNFLISEIIREQCLNLLQQEIPYGVAVLVESAKYDSIKNIFNIEASIVVERESHKSIVIGAKASMIKQIGTSSRMELLKIYDCNIFLKLFVKVNKDWRNSLTKLKEFGYFN